MDDTGMGWLGAIVVGGIAGWLAELITRSNTGILVNVVLGVIGAGLAIVAIRPHGHPPAGRVARLPHFRLRRARALLIIVTRLISPTLVAGLITPPMFLFISNRMGCLGSIFVSILVSLVLLKACGMYQAPRNRRLGDQTHRTERFP